MKKDIKDNNNVIHFLFTGGTIDSYYEGTKDTVVPLEHSIIPRVFGLLKLYIKTEFTEICMKDSRSLSDEDMKNLLKTVEESPHSHIIVTHGTYTMPDSARYLQANLKRKDQTIVFTGSYIPIDGFSPSDGSFNLGYAIARVQDLPSGIYVAMNGRVFNPAEIRKALYEGRFESIFGEKL